jgi:hypothetical protein
MNSSELPEGITFNQSQGDSVELEASEEVINTTVCNICDACFESILINYNGRHEGRIQIVGGNYKVIWKNSLPKDRVRSIKLLDEHLMTKINIHKERHKND